MVLRKRINHLSRSGNGRKGAWKATYRLNVMPGEFNAEISDIQIEKEPEKIDEEKEILRTQVGDLQQSMAAMQEELAKRTEERDREHDNAVCLCEGNAFLSSHISAMEAEMREKEVENIKLKESNIDLQQQQRQNQKESKPLGRKKFSELGSDAISLTRASYRETFVDPVNRYGENRGLVVDKIVLRDKDSGKQLEVNAEKPNTYETLNDDERRRVKLASRWKDKERVSDRGQSKLSHVGDLPAASHVKAFEKELNAKLGEIQIVSCRYYCCYCCCC